MTEVGIKYTPEYGRKRDEVGHVQPNVEFCEPDRPKLTTEIAPYLPVVGYDPFYQDWFVALTGKVFTKDEFGFATFAGLKLQIDAVIAAGSLAAPGVTLDVYTSNDVAVGTRNSMGVLAQVGEPVVASMIDATLDIDPVDGFEVTGAAVAGKRSATLHIGHPIGFLPYRRYRSMFKNGTGSNLLVPQGHPLRPYGVHTELKTHATELENNRMTLCTRYVVRLPVVTEGSIATMPNPGMTVFNTKAGAPKQAAYVSFDERSDLVLLNESTQELADRIGIILHVDKNFPKAMLDKVTTRWDNTDPQFAAWGTLDAMPGSATNGLDDAITYAGGSASLGVVHVKLDFK